MHLILIIEDDRLIQGILKLLFETNGFRVLVAETASRGEHDARVWKPDAVLVDLGLPDGDGLTVVAAIRRWSPVPIVVVTARTAELQRLEAFEKGADDYVVKPFSSPELVARVHAILRRHVRGPLPMGILQLGDVAVDLGKRIAHHHDGHEVHFTPIEHRILESLARHADRIVTHAVIMKEVWGVHRGDPRSLRVYIGALRKKLEIDSVRPQHIVTELGVGYRLVTGRTAEAERGPGGDARVPDATGD
jgi:two-component system KDP operon response regulator KdpE